MKTKINFARMLVFLIVAFLWGGQLSAYAEKKAWVQFFRGSLHHTLTFYYGEKDHFDNNEYELNAEWEEPGWLTRKDEVTKVIFDDSFADARPKSCYKWFCDFRKLTTIEGIEYLNTSEVTNMNSMFSTCTKLTSLDLSHFDTQKVLNMTSMFSFCSNIEVLDLSSFNTSKVVSMLCMFQNCSQLTTIYATDAFVVSAIDNDNNYGANMFLNCSNLKGDINYTSSCVDKTYATTEGGYFTYKLSPFVRYADGTLTFMYGKKSSLSENDYDLNTDKNAPGWESQNSNVTKVVFDASFSNARPTSCYYWFHGCNQLEDKNITGLNYLNTSEVKTFRDMFWNCAKFTTLDLSTFNTEKCEDMAGMFNACSGLTSLNIPSFKTDKVTDMIYMFYDCSSLQSLDLSHFNTQNVTSMEYMFYGCKSLNSLDLSKFNTQNVDNMSFMFNGCNNLKSLDVSKFNTSKVTTMRSMFKECKNLKSLDVSKFNTSKVTTMRSMFNDCNNLQSLDVSKFDTQNVTTMYCMFYRCNNLQSLDVSKFNTSKVKSMRSMFYGCSNLQSLDVSKFDTQNVTTMYCMFYGCSNLQSLDVSNFDTQNVTTMYCMFYGCQKLQSLDVSKFNTSKVTTMEAMFKFCNNLKSLDVSKFDTQNLKTMKNMFVQCYNLKSLDLSNFDTHNVTSMYGMFYNCNTLQTIYVGDKFTTTNVNDHTDMFYNCRSLFGDIKWDANNAIDKTYAKVDGGYFTDKVYTRPWVKYTDGALTFKYGYKKTLDNEEYAMNEAWDNPSWNSKSSSVRKVVFDNSFAYARPTTCYRWFANCSNLTDIEGIENLNTSESTVLHLMFYSCKKLTSLDLSNFDTRKVTNMNWMFRSCSNLKNIYVSDKFVGGSTEKFAESSSVFYCSPVQYNAVKKIEAFANNTVKPYVSINPNAEYGTLCVPIGSTLAESSYSGFDKLYTIKGADKDKGTITMVEAAEIEPGVAYVYHRNLPEGDTESIITFDADMDESTAVTAPNNENSLLKGTFSRITAPGGCYILQTDGNFHPVSADNTTLGVGAYRAYLDLSSLDVDGGYAKAYKMVFEDSQTTAIDGVSKLTNKQPKTYLDLMGRRVSTPKIGGLYIVNGKKVMYKN